MTKAPFALCHKCPLKERKFVPGSGAKAEKASFVFLGEAPGYREAANGVPFVGPSGQLLRGILQELDIRNAYFTNTVLCHPAGNRFDLKAQEACSKRLTEELRPYVAKGVPLVLLGKKAVGSILPEHEGQKMNDLAGRWFKDNRIFVLHHPAYILRVPALMSYYIYDFQRLVYGSFKIPDVQYEHVRTYETLMDKLSWLTNFRERTLVVDVESRGLRYWKDDLLTIGIAWSETEALVFDAELLENRPAVYALNVLLKKHKIVGHNYKFDLKMLRHQYGVALHDFEDTMIAHYALDENVHHGLKDLLWLYFGIEDYQTDMLDKYLSKKSDDWGKIPREVLAHYNAFDVCYNYLLWTILEGDLEDEQLYNTPYRYPMMESQVPLTDTELGGIKIDDEQKAKLSETFRERLEEIYEQMKKLSTGEDFNPASWQQVSKIMYGYFDMPMVSGRGYKKGSTCAAAREQIKKLIFPESQEAKWLDLLEDYRTLDKLRGSYVENIDQYQDDKGYIHPDFVVTGTEVGRLSARDPAIQTIPRSSSGEVGEIAWGKEIKRMYVPEEGHYIMQADYSQAEMRVMAAHSEDDFLVSVYRQGKDLHDATATKLFGEDFTYEQRQLAKNFNFALIYGGTEHSFETKGLDAVTGRQLVRKYRSLMGGVLQWKEQQFEDAKTYGKVVSSFNRQRRFPLLLDDTIEDIRKASGHMPIAGDASDLTLISLIRLYRWLKEEDLWPDTRIFATVHDSILLIVNKDCVHRVGKKVKEIMEGVGNEYFTEVPWRCDLEIGETWGDLKEASLEYLESLS